MVNKALQSRASSTSPIPNLNFLDFQRKIILITEDIKKLRKSSFLMKMKNTLTSSGPSLDGKSHMDGSLLAKTSKKPGLDSIVSELSKDPTSTTSRVKLIRTLMQDQSTLRKYTSSFGMQQLVRLQHSLRNRFRESVVLGRSHKVSFQRCMNTCVQQGGSAFLMKSKLVLGGPAVRSGASRIMVLFPTLSPWQRALVTERRSHVAQPPMRSRAR